VGTDIANGLWAIHGARLGTYMAVVQRMDISKVRDFDYLNHMFNESILPYQDILWHDCNRLGELINDKLIGDVLSISDSEQYKKLPSILRSEENFIKYKFHPPYDVVFISNDEPNSEKNFAILQEKVPEAKRATSLVEASKITSTDFFWAVDHNSIVVDQFDFEYNIDFFGPLKEYVFIAKNSKTGEFNKDGAVRLIPRMTAYRQETVPEEPVIIFSNITEK
jgi:hypothetical protein